MRPASFTKIQFRRRNTSQAVRVLPELLGIDTETYLTGKPFMCCLSNGEEIDIAQIPARFFSREYRNQHFVAYKLKFDSGSLLSVMPAIKRKQLAKTERCTWRGYKWLYIPHKCLRISKGKNAVTFWDISQFYKTSLNTAANDYLAEKKDDIKSKLFTPENVPPQRENIKKYCTRDAYLAARLANYFVGKLAGLGIKVNNLYSPASIAYTDFRTSCGIVDMTRHIRFNREMLNYAYQAYHGGKFEVTARGKFNGFEYDGLSAYAFELSKLRDISEAQVRYFKEFIPDADYGFIKVRFEIPPHVHHPVPVKHLTLAYYPVGRIETIITKAEYEFMESAGVRLDVVDGWYLFCPNAPARYRDRIEYLYGIKEDKEHQDPIIRDCARIILSGFYGKNAQLTARPGGTYVAGPAFNPVFAAIITANWRIRVSQLQNQLKDDCLAVHTDAIISRKGLPTGFLGRKLGDWAQKGSGNGVIVACGLYQLGKKNKMRGLTLNRKTTWFDILANMGKNSVCELTESRVMSWLHAAHLDTPEKTNIFDTLPKILDLNCDTKRVWLRKTNAAALLAGTEQSIPRIIQQF